jgi:hypothetical protein
MDVFEAIRTVLAVRQFAINRSRSRSSGRSWLLGS